MNARQRKKHEKRAFERARNRETLKPHEAELALAWLCHLGILATVREIRLSVGQPVIGFGGS